MNQSGNPLTILDFELANTKLQKYAQELFAGTDEEKKIQVLVGMQKLIDPSTDASIKPPTEDVYWNRVSEINNDTNTDTDDDASTDIDSDTNEDTNSNCDSDTNTNSDTESVAETNTESDAESDKDSDTNTDDEVGDNISATNYPNRLVPKLPNELWIKIMSYLKNKDIFRSFGLVNKNFHSLTLDPSAVKYLHLKDAKKKQKSNALYRKWMEVIKRSKNLIELSIEDNYNHLNWNHLIEEVLKTSQCLKSLKIRYDTQSPLSSGVTKSLKLARCLQSFETDKVILGKDFLDEICKLETLRRFSVYDSGNPGNMNSKFVECLALSKNPIEVFNTNTDIYPLEGKELFANAIKTLYTEKRNTIKTLYTHNLRRENDHRKCYLLANFNMCRNVTSFFGRLHEHDLELITDLPKLETLSILQPIHDINYIKAFHRMNFSKLKYLYLIVNTKREYENMFKELSNITFPSLKRLYVDNYFGVKSVSVTEKTLEKLVSNAPNLKSLMFQSSIDCVSKITYEFIFKMLKNEDLALIIQSLDHPDRRHRGDLYDKNLKDFLKEKGSTFYEKYKSMEIESWERYFMKLGDR